MSLALGIDIGTSGIRTAVVDQSGALLSMARAAHLPQDPESVNAALWWQAVQTCVRNQVKTLTETGHDPLEIARIAVDGTSGTMVLTDASLNPVSQALMYNSKGFEGEAAQIARYAPASHITQGSNSALGRAMRLAKGAENAAHLQHQADFIVSQLTGNGSVSDHNNALKTGFDPETGQWPDWIGALINPTLLPDPKPVGSEIAPLSMTTAFELGLSSDAIVCAGTTDSIAAFLAAAPLETGNAVTSLGSTLSIKMLSSKRIDDPAIGLYAHKVGDSWLVGGASNTGGAVLLEHFTPKQMAGLSDLMDPDSATGLDYYPLSRPGERFPINDPNLRPRMTPRPNDDVTFLQAMFEGIASIEARCYQEIEMRGGGLPTRVFTAGGGAANPVWGQIRARYLGLTPSIPAQTEAAFGVARLAMPVA